MNLRLRLLGNITYLKTMIAVTIATRVNALKPKANNGQVGEKPEYKKN